MMSIPSIIYGQLLTMSTGELTAGSPALPRSRWMAVVRQRPLRLQVSTALAGAVDCDEFEDMVMELQPGVRTIDDVVLALVDSYAHDIGSVVPDHKQLLVQCLDEER